MPKRLEYEAIEGYLLYYANKFQCSRFDYWELVSEAWLLVHKYTIIQFVSNGVRWAMQNYMRTERSRDYKGSSKFIATFSIDAEIVEGLYGKGLIMEDDPNIDNIDNVDKLEHALNISYLNLNDKLLIDQRYFRGLTLQRMGTINGCTRECIRQRLAVLLEKIKRFNNVKTQDCSPVKKKINFRKSI